MPITLEELKASVQELRKRRLAIPELRDYRPQSRKSAKSPTVPDKPVEETFSDLFNRPIQQEEGGESK